MSVVTNLLGMPRESDKYVEGSKAALRTVRTPMDIKTTYLLCVRF